LPSLLFSAVAATAVMMPLAMFGLPGEPAKAPLATTPLIVERPLDGVGGGQGDEKQGSFRAVFIRAPWVEQTGPGVSILGTDLGTGRIVAVRQGKLLATAFHPELTPDRRIHQLFVDIVKDNT
jgi:5'-phosphate synthase pdxT subunit